MEDPFSRFLGDSTARQAANAQQQQMTAQPSLYNQTTNIGFGGNTGLAREESYVTAGVLETINKCSNCRYVPYKLGLELCFFHGLKMEITDWTYGVLDNG